MTINNSFDVKPHKLHMSQKYEYQNDVSFRSHKQKRATAQMKINK
jgi:hypothetical protein